MWATESLTIQYLILEELEASEPGAAAEPQQRKRKKHRCNTCVLTVWEHYPSAARPEFSTYIQDECHVQQKGPYCAAASVAGMIHSFAAELCPETATLENATQASIVNVYKDMKVPGLEKSTARIGNLTWKRAMRTVAVPESAEEGALLTGQVRFAPRDFEPSIRAPEGVHPADELWQRLCADMQAGVRFMYHCANHYTRLYGFRESLPGVDADTLGPPVAGPGSADDRSAVEEVLGGDSDNEADKASPSASSEPSLPASIAFEWGAHKSPSSGTRREVLTAKRGQGPKHWVSWEQIVADISKHRLHKLFAVTAVDRRARERRAVLKLREQEQARAASAAKQQPLQLVPSKAGSDLLNAPLDGVTIVRSAEAARKVVDILEKLPVDVHHAWDTEVSEIDVATQSPVGNGKVICASFYSGPEIDFGTGPQVWIDNLGDANGTLGVFKEFLEDPARKKVFHNVGFDRHVLYNEGIDMVGLSADTMHMARVWSTSRSKQGGYSLETLSNDLLGHRKVPMKERFSKPKLKKDGTPGKDRFLPGVDEIQLGAETRAAWIDYSTYDAEATWHLRENLAEKLTQMPWAQDRSMLQFYEQYIVPFAMLLTDMERAGIRVDVETHMPQAETQALKDKEKHTSEFLRWARKFQPDIKRMNIGSDAQKAQFLFAPACRSNGRAPRALEAAKKRTLAKFGPQRPASGEHPVPDPNRNGGALDAADWMEWLDPEGKLYHPETHEWADPDSWPPGRPFKVDNEEGYIEPGKTKAKKQRDLWIRGLGIPPVEVTAGGWPAASGAVLKELAGDVEAVPPRYGKALEHFGGGCEGEKACSAIHSLVSVGAIDTMLSNFILPLQQMVDGDSRVHCSMNLNTDTGRLSARRPNLQNQPALEKDRYQIRKAFCAAPGNKLVIADYGQLELRVLAHMARCKSMIDAFASGGDFHSRTALGMYDYIKDAIDVGDCLLEWDESKGERPVPLLKNLFASERRKAKVLNFSIAYGKTPIGLSRDWNVSLDEAKETLEKWYSDRPEVRQWQEQVLDIARRTGSTRTLMGRYRDLPEINSVNRGLRGHAQRAAINTPIQGGAADVVMMAMLKIGNDKRLSDMGWKMLLQIHDEVILEGPEESAEEALSCLVEDMEHPFAQPLLVDLVVDAAIASTWYEGK